MELPPTEVTRGGGSRTRHWYGASISEFVDATADAVVGQIATNAEFAVLPTQRDAWLSQIAFLHSQISGLSGSIFFEFSIPRMGRRIDVVLVIGAVVFAVEFKVGEKTLDRAAKDQVWDYALDLKNFHKASHHVAIVPILIATEATACPPLALVADADQVYRPILTITELFRGAIDAALADVHGEKVAADAWSTAPYHPTPTIVEAARALYANHSVDAIARFDAGAKNLNVTSKRIEELVDPVQYFLNDRDDVRSSYYLEDAATEFQVQGLELDWACVTWDGDFRFNGLDWDYHDFRGSRWCKINNADNRVFLRNAYRVLLTRARQGMIVFVPPGDANDPTRSPAYYDSTFDYLRTLGIAAIP